MQPPGLEGHAQGLAGAEQVGLADHLVERARAQPLGQGRLGRQRGRQLDEGEGQYERLDARQAVKLVAEQGLTFEVNLSDYLDTGLFVEIDTDAVRSACAVATTGGSCAWSPKNSQRCERSMPGSACGIGSWPASSNTV